MPIFNPTVPGGSTGAVQYNNAGVFGGSAATLDSVGHLILPVGSIAGSGLLSLAFTGDVDTGFYRRSAGLIQFMSQGNYSFGIGGGVNTYFQIANELKLQREAAYTMALRGDTNAMVWRIYETVDGLIPPTNYSRLVSKAVAGAAFQILTEAGGTGTQRDLSFGAPHHGFGVAVPTAIVHLKAGTATANTAPLKFTTGTLLTSVEAGAMEYFQNSLWFTNLAVRRTVVQGQNVITADQTIANTTTETTIFTQAHAANYAQVGKCEEIVIQGIVSSLITGVPTANSLTVRVKYAGSTLGSFVILKSATANRNIEVHVRLTFRAIGNGTTTIQVHANADAEGATSDPVFNGTTSSLDSTTAQATTVTVQWSDADAGNTTTIQQGYALSIDNNA